MALVTRYSTFITALRASWTGPGEDRIVENDEELRLDIDDKYITFVHENARPTDPYLLKIKIEDIKELAELMKRKQNCRITKPRGPNNV